MDSFSENTSSSSFKKNHKKEYHKHYLEDDDDILNEIQRTLEEQNHLKKKRKMKRSSSLIMFFPLVDLNHSLNDDESEDMEEHPVTFQNCFNLFFNQKDKIEIYEEEELEKYYLLKGHKLNP